jgi:RNA polymerase sigma factor (sigma-70 family)
VSAHDELERLYREQGARLWRAVFLYTRDAEVASDAVAETFAQALRRGDAIRAPATWVWTVAFRVAAGEMKERRRHGAPLDERAEELASGAAASKGSPEMAMDLARALQRLSEKQRAAFVLHHYAGYPHAEVARIIGSTTAAVAVHLYRARARLRDLMREIPDDG